MTQAVITLDGKQHLVSQGDSFAVDKHVEAKEGETFLVDQVLMIIDGEKTILGEPTVEGAKVSLKVLTLDKADKVITARFRAKSRYRRTVGHRQPRTTLEVTKIELK